MKQALLLVVGVILVLGCGRDAQTPKAKVPQAAPASSAPSDPGSSAYGGFLETPSAEILNPESVGARILSQSQDLFRQGKRDDAVDLLRKAANDPACQSERTFLVRKLVALLLSCGNEKAAMDTCLEYKLAARPDESNIKLITGYFAEKGDQQAQAEWKGRTERLPANKLDPMLGSAIHLAGLVAADKTDEVVRKVSEIVASPDEVRNAPIIDAAVDQLISRADFEGAERLLSVVETAAGNKPAYTARVSNLRERLAAARTQAATGK